MLSLIAAAFAYEWQRLSGDRETMYLVLLIVPASAAIAFLSVGIVVPSLIPSGRFRWPLMVTLPVVYGALLQLCAALWTRGPNPIVKQEFFSRACEFWQRLPTAVGLLVCQVFVLSVWAVVSGGRERMHGRKGGGDAR